MVLLWDFGTHNSELLNTLELSKQVQLPILLMCSTKNIYIAKQRNLSEQSTLEYITE